MKLLTQIVPSIIVAIAWSAFLSVSFGQSYDGIYNFEELKKVRIIYPMSGQVNGRVIQRIKAKQISYEIEDADTVIFDELREVESKFSSEVYFNRFGSLIQIQDIWSGENPTTFVSKRLTYDEENRLVVVEKIHAKTKDSLVLRYNSELCGSQPNLQIRYYRNNLGFIGAIDSLFFDCSNGRLGKSAKYYVRYHQDSLFNQLASYPRKEVKLEVHELKPLKKDFAITKIFRVRNTNIEKGQKRKLKCETSYIFGKDNNRLLRVETKCEGKLQHQQIFLYTENGLIDKMIEKEGIIDNGDHSVIETHYTYLWY